MRFVIIDVVIADQQELCCLGTAQVLAASGDFRVVGQPQSPEQSLNTLAQGGSRPVSRRR